MSGVDAAQKSNQSSFNSPWKSHKTHHLHKTFRPKHAPYAVRGIPAYSLACSFLATSHHLPLSLSLPPSISLSFCISHHLSLSFSLTISLSVSHHLSLAILLSLFPHLRLSLSLSARLSRSPSFTDSRRLSPHLSPCHFFTVQSQSAVPSGACVIRYHNYSMTSVSVSLHYRSFRLSPRPAGRQPANPPTRRDPRSRPAKPNPAAALRPVLTGVFQNKYEAGVRA